MIDKINHYSLTSPASVYDEEALTALQLAGRTAAKLNEAIDAYNALEKSTGDKLKAQTDFIEKMNAVTMPEKVKAEVDNHIKNGDFDKAINTYIGNLEERVDNLLGSVTTGSTTLDAEVIDMRTRLDGKQETNAGTALRNIDRIASVVNPAMTGGCIRLLECSDAEPHALSPDDFEYGSIAADGDNDYFAASRCRNKAILTCPFDLVIYAHNHEALTRMVVHYYTPSGEYISDSGWVTDIKIPKNTFFRLQLTLNPNENNATAISDIVAGFKIQSNNTSVDVVSLVSMLSCYDGKEHSFNVADFENGGIYSGSNGAWYAESRIRSKALMISPYDMTIRAKKSGELYRVVCLFYDENKQFTNSIEWCESLVVPKNTLFRLMMTNNPNVNTPSAVADVLKNFTITAHVESDIAERNREALTNIQAAKKYFEQRYTDQFGPYSHNNLFTIAHITDVHRDKIRYQNFIDFVKANRGLITSAVNTGDFVDDPNYTEINEIFSVHDGSVVYPVVGNHDRQGNTTERTLAEICSYMGIDKQYYSVPYSDYGIRLIVLCQYEQHSGDYHYTSAQLNWLISELETASTNGEAVLIAMHRSESTPKSNDKGFYQRFDPWVFANDMSCDGTPVEDIIDAWTNAKTISRTYNYAWAGDSYTINHTFTNAGVFVAYLTGHQHIDIIGYSEKYPKQLILGLTVGACSTVAAADMGSGISDLPRISGTVTEDAFNVYGIDTINRVVKVVRVGSSVNDLMEDRKKAYFPF